MVPVAVQFPTQVSRTALPGGVGGSCAETTELKRQTNAIDVETRKPLMRTSDFKRASLAQTIRLRLGAVKAEYWLQVTCEEGSQARVQGSPATIFEFGKAIAPLICFGVRRKGASLTTPHRWRFVFGEQ